MKKKHFENIIIGGGISGQIAQKLLAPRHAVIISDKISLNNRAAFYCHQPIPDIKTIPTKVVWTIMGQNTSIDTCRRKYAKKVYKYTNVDVSIAERQGIAHILDSAQFSNISDWIQHTVLEIDLNNKKLVTTGGDFYYDNLISTIPLPVFIRLSKKSFTCHKLLKHFKFPSIPIYITQEHYRGAPRGMFINYYPDKTQKFYRETIFNETLTREYVSEVEGSLILNPGKIIPCGKYIDRKIDHFIYHMENVFDVWMIGRYANWKRKYMVHNGAEKIKEFLNEK